MATHNTVISAAGRGGAVALQAPGTAIAAADTNQWDINNISDEAAGVAVLVNVTAVTTASITVKVYALDAYSIARLLITSAAITATGQTVLRVHSNITGDLTAGVGTKAQDLIGSRIRVEVVNGNANSNTYSVSATLAA